MVTAKELRALLEKQNYRCALTGVELTPETTQLDHRVPLSRGGNSELDNFQWLHSTVNQAKNAATNEEFIAMCERVIAHSKAVLVKPEE